jgi:hypothetical protein
MKPVKLESKHHRYADAAADRRQFSEDSEDEWRQRATQNRTFNVLGPVCCS